MKRMNPVTLRRVLLVAVVAALVAASAALGWITAHWGAARAP